MENPGKEQTSSLFSLVTFSWLNETVSKASRVEHLPLDEFPPLADSNATKNLTDRSFKVRLRDHVIWRCSRLTGDCRMSTHSSAEKRSTCFGDS